MKLTKIILTAGFLCISMTSFGQTVLGSGSIDVRAELISPITVTGTLLDFKKVAIPSTGLKY
jgi:hypothetical protein